MSGVTRIPRSRGSLCGLLLVVLGAWGALAPFVGPYFKFAFTPDKAMDYTTGRLYLSILPGAAALLGGLLVLITRSRVLGVLGGLLAAAGGAWFTVGLGVSAHLLHRPSITAGTPITRSGAAVTTSVSGYQELEILAFFIGLGVAIVFFAALAIGRFTGPGVAVTADAASYGDGDFLDTEGGTSSLPDQYTASGTQAGQRPFAGEETTQAQERFPSITGQFPATPTSRFPESS
jgi:hypothetical protein